MNTSRRLAVLIDADNAQPAAIDGIFEEVKKLGTATVRRAYGDWTTDNLKGWKETLHRLAIQPIQQFSYTTKKKKNATDAALIIDAMDLLHAGRLDGFCLVSSDSDFTRLATRLREAGLAVYGFGEDKTPKAFSDACDDFIPTQAPKQLPSSSPPVQMAATAKVSKELAALIHQAVVGTAREDGWSALTDVGSWLKKSAEFAPLNPAGLRPVKFIRQQQSDFNFRKEPTGVGAGQVEYIQPKVASKT